MVRPFFSQVPCTVQSFDYLFGQSTYHIDQRLEVKLVQHQDFHLSKTSSKLHASCCLRSIFGNKWWQLCKEKKQAIACKKVPTVKHECRNIATIHVAVILRHSSSFHLTKGHVTFFRPETIVLIFLHLLALFYKVISDHASKHLFVVLLYCMFSNTYLNCLLYLINYLQVTLQQNLPYMSGIILNQFVFFTVILHSLRETMRLIRI